MSSPSVGFRLLCQWLKLRQLGFRQRVWRNGPLLSGEPLSSRGGRKGLRSSIYVMRGRGLRLRAIPWRLALFLAASLGIAAFGHTAASADTLEWALVQAYQNNPSLNAQRAALRAADENVPQALSGYRPKLSVTASGGYNYFSEVNKTVNQQVFPNSVVYSTIGESLPTRQFGATATQTLFNGFQTANRTRQ